MKCLVRSELSFRKGKENGKNKLENELSVGAQKIAEKRGGTKKGAKILAWTGKE